MKIAIHQPNFFPYYGFFQKMDQVDLFVIMGHCQFEKNNYQNRFNIGNDWLTMSVNSGLEPIKNKKYLNSASDWDKIKKKIKNKTLEYFDFCISDNLYNTNVCIIKRLANILGIETKIAYDYETDLKGTDRLIDICKHYGATKYLSGISGKSYLELDKFKDVEIGVEFQEGIINKPIIQAI